MQKEGGNNDTARRSSKKQKPEEKCKARVSGFGDIQ
jgi:hypothetical protein